VLTGTSIAKSLKRINLSDNQFNDVPETMECIRFCFLKNLELGRYDFKYNNITENGVEELCKILEEARHVFELDITERISKEMAEKFKEKLQDNKPKRGGKKGKKKKKK